ncbi:hypothetical protein QBC46DRAFT_87249 [Diplogelasinospora grovesii]|uniref:Apple domain-containing protein n=1 Tax=Diplogelasinospora grovesii TaxID=303347 RepID=A0AAN6NBZ6_9PEZI|nr:hypothetical protein QBC46DRAFT_87249 [Diplogelasinospora grovesii]
MDPPQRQGSSASQSQSRPRANSHNTVNKRLRFAEDELGLEEVSHHPSPQPVLPSIERKGAAVPVPIGAAAVPAAVPAETEAPEVYWADDVTDADANLEAQYTFYREGTPTPPESASDREKAGEGASHGEGGVAALGQSSVAAEFAGFGFGFDPPAAEGSNWSRGSSGSGSGGGGGGGGSNSNSNSSHGNICGLSKRAFWPLVAVLALLVVGLAVGVGVGISLSRKTSEAATTATTPTPSSAFAINSSTTSASFATTPTSSSTTSSNETPRPTYNSDCPAANNSIYHVSGSTKTFLRVCGLDYSGAGGAADLADVYTSSMPECINRCASFDQCTGCGWGYIFGDTGDTHRCWMKSNLKTSHNATADWCFAVLQR